MIILTAVDDRNGLLFNHRRQSQDAALREHILALTGESRLWMNAYSFKQFEGMEESLRAGITVDEEFLTKAAEDDYCFVENVPVLPCVQAVKKVILFKWNRAYPGDFFFDLQLTEPFWRKTETSEFAGTSHETITKEIYEHEL